MSTATVTIELSNYGDLLLARAGHLNFARVRRASVVCVADFGVMQAILPKSVVEQLGLPAAELPAIHNGERRERVKNASVELFGRECAFSAVVVPDSSGPVLGAIVLGTLDLIVDCGKNELVPRDPNGIISEVE